MQARLLRCVERVARIVVDASAAQLPPERRAEIVATVLTVSAESARRRGTAGLCVAAAAELLDIAFMPLRRHLGREPRVSSTHLHGQLLSHRGSLMAMHEFQRALRRLRSNPATLTLSVGMLALAIVLLICWFLGWAVFHVAGALIHLLLIVAVVVFIYRLITGRKTV